MFKKIVYFSLFCAMPASYAMERTQEYFEAPTEAYIAYRKAISDGHYELVAQYVAENAEVAVKDRHGFDPVLFAVVEKLFVVDSGACFAIFRLLVEKGANSEAKVGSMPLVDFLMMRSKTRSTLLRMDGKDQDYRDALYITGSFLTCLSDAAVIQGKKVDSIEAALSEINTALQDSGLTIPDEKKSVVSDLIQSLKAGNTTPNFEGGRKQSRLGELPSVERLASLNEAIIAGDLRKVKKFVADYPAYTKKSKEVVNQARMPVIFMVLDGLFSSKQEDLDDCLAVFEYLLSKKCDLQVEFNGKNIFDRIGMLGTKRNPSHKVTEEMLKYAPHVIRWIAVLIKKVKEQGFGEIITKDVITEQENSIKAFKKALPKLKEDVNKLKEQLKELEEQVKQQKIAEEKGKTQIEPIARSASSLFESLKVAAAKPQLQAPKEDVKDIIAAFKEASAANKEEPKSSANVKDFIASLKKK